MGFSWTQVAAAAFSSYDFWFGINHKVMRFLWRSQLWKFNITCHVQRFVSTKSSDPLRILFCGSDNFSIESLRALNDERQKDAESIASIDVVCRPGKRIGRDLKTVREVPISSTAKALSLPLHQIDTFTGWKPPTPQGKDINLVIAVSFGLLVPSRILDGAKYGGLNVHPSMLPDFRGPAPLHHTLLSGCKTAGITLQTLHPKHFDRGTILAQTPYPGFFHEATNVSQLEALVMPKAAEMLVQGIRDRTFVHPLQDVGWHKNDRQLTELRHAPKITTEDRHIDWEKWTAEEILRRHRVIGPLWNFAQSSTAGQSRTQRIIWTSGFSKVPHGDKNLLRPGHPILKSLDSAIQKSQSVFIRTCDGYILQTDEAKIEGGRAEKVSVASRRAGMIELSDKPETLPQSSACFRSFLE